MNNEENHGFTSFDFIAMMCSFLVIALVTGPIIKKNIQADQSVERARTDTIQISRLLLNPKNLPALAMSENFSLKGNRAVASVPKDNGPHFDLDSLKSQLKEGEAGPNQLGQDPWGKPYHYAVLRNEKGMATHIAVWSDGPNKASDTAFDPKINSDSLDFKGDDLGTVVPIR